MLLMIDRARVENWAQEHLSETQRTELLALIEESSQGQMEVADMWTELRTKKRRAVTGDEAFNAETPVQKIAESPLAFLGAGDYSFEESSPGEHAPRFFHELADRIPMTEQQQLAIYDALQKGATPPIDAYEYQTRPADQIEAEVRSNTDWMSKVLTTEQYETYLRHYLAQIEIIRFQISQ